jgi:hemerythrin-like domain-containing protein
MASKRDPDAIDLLMGQHRMVERLFEQIEEADDGDTKEQLFVQLADSLAMHSKIEEVHFYPACKSDQTEEQLREAAEEHLAVKRVLADMLEMDVEDEEFDAKCSVLQEMIEHHVEEEEGELFPRARKMLSEEELLGLAAEMSALQAELEKQEPRLAVPSETDEPAPV